MPIKKIASALFLTLSLSGCSFLYDTFVYQIDITQGNYIDDEKIAQLEIGMSQEQIIFILARAGCSSSDPVARTYTYHLPCYRRS